MSPIQTRIIEKVRKSGCLSEEELQSFEDFSRRWEARLRVDQLDCLWANEVSHHVTCVKHNGISTYHLPTRGNSKFTAGLGVACLLHGVIGLPLMGGEGAFFMGAVLAVFGVMAIFRSKKDQRGWEAYDGARSAHYEERNAVMQVLPEEERPANRVCLHCVKAIE